MSKTQLEMDLEASIASMERQIKTYKTEGLTMGVTNEDLSDQIKLMGIELLKALDKAMSAAPAAAATGNLEMRTYPVGIVSAAWVDGVSKAGKSYTQFHVGLSNGKKVRTFNKDLAAIIEGKVGAEELTLTVKNTGALPDSRIQGELDLCALK